MGKERLGRREGAREGEASLTSMSLILPESETSLRDLDLRVGLTSSSSLDDVVDQRRWEREWERERVCVCLISDVQGDA